MLNELDVPWSVGIDTDTDTAVKLLYGSQQYELMLQLAGA